MPTRHRGPEKEVRGAQHPDHAASRGGVGDGPPSGPARRGVGNGRPVRQPEALYHLGPMRPNELARKLLRSPGNMTTVLDNLERRPGGPPAREGRPPLPDGPPHGRRPKAHGAALPARHVADVVRRLRGADRGGAGSSCAGSVGCWGPVERK